MIQIRTIMACLVLAVPAFATGQEIVVKDEPATGLQPSPSPPGARVYFRELSDGDVVDKSLKVQFGIDGMKVRSAGKQQEYSGHHHLLINVDELPPLDLPLPKTEGIYHFGKAEKSAVINLPPGEHTLQLIFADYMHVPHDPPVMSEKITVIVEE